MNKSGSETQAAHRKVQTSTTLNRKYVKAPAANLSSEKLAQDYRAERQRRRQAIADQMNREAAARTAKKHQQKTIVMDKTTIITSTPKPAPKLAADSATPKPTPDELKNQAIAKALKSAKKTKKAEKPKFGFGRVLLALSCSAVVVLGIVYFVNLNMPDFSLRIAAMQTGIEATYPSYIPRNFSLKGINSENNKVTITFGNSENKTFTLTEEKSSWDSATLLNNYVKGNYTDYSTVREQGLTIYMSGNKATWVSGGIIYEIISNSDALSKKQIKSVAVSL